MTKYKIGMILQSKTTPFRIKLTSRHSGNGHWNSCKINGSNKNHKIHEKTLDKYYEVINDL